MSLETEKKLEALLLKVEAIEEKINQGYRPATEVILDDVDVCKLLKISKRTLATLKSERILIPSTPLGKAFYTLHDLVEMIEKNRTPAR